LSIAEKLTDDLWSSVIRYRHPESIGDPIISISGATAQLNNDDELHVNLTLSNWSTEVQQQLESTGLEIDVLLPDEHIVEGWLPLQNVEDLADLDFVDLVSVPNYGVSNIGLETSLGDTISRASDVRSRFTAMGLDGSGVKIGVISDGANGWERL
jgi:hypothetical protein